MATVVLVIHLLIAIALVAVILIQRSEGGGLGLGGGTAGGLMTARGSANLLTRTTAVLATAFMLTSLLLAILAGRDRGVEAIIERPAAGEAPAPAPVAPAPAEQGPPAPPVAQ